MMSVDPSVMIFSCVWGAKSPDGDGKQRGKEYSCIFLQMVNSSAAAFKESGFCLRLSWTQRREHIAIYVQQIQQTICNLFELCGFELIALFLD